MPESVFDKCTCEHERAAHAEDGCRAWGRSQFGLPNCQCRRFVLAEGGEDVQGVPVWRLIDTMGRDHGWGRRPPTFPSIPPNPHVAHPLTLEAHEKRREVVLAVLAEYRLYVETGAFDEPEDAANALLRKLGLGGEDA